MTFTWDTVVPSVTLHYYCVFKDISIHGFCCFLALLVAYWPWQEIDGLLTLVGVLSCFGLTVPFQANIPVVLLRAICVVVVFFILLQEVTLIIQCLLRQENEREEKRKEDKICFIASRTILAIN